MAKIIFTRMDWYDGKIVYRYGSFDIVARKDGVTVLGQMDAEKQETGDDQIMTISETLAKAWAEPIVKPKNPDTSKLTIDRGSGNHPKAGPYVAYKCPDGLVIKVTTAGTEIQFGVPAKDKKFHDPGTSPMGLRSKEQVDQVRTVLIGLVKDRAQTRHLATKKK